MHLKIVRPMVKELAELDLLFSCKNKKTLNFAGLTNVANVQISSQNSKLINSEYDNANTIFTSYNL